MVACRKRTKIKHANSVGNTHMGLSFLKLQYREATRRSGPNVARFPIRTQESIARLIRKHSRVSVAAFRPSRAVSGLGLALPPVPENLGPEFGDILWLPREAGRLGHPLAPQMVDPAPAACEVRKGHRQSPALNKAQERKGRSIACR